MRPAAPGQRRTRRPREVSCLALTFFYDYLAQHQIPRRSLQQGLSYSPEYLDDRLNWIDYATFLQLEHRMAELFPDDPDCFFNIGRSVGSTLGFGFIRVVTRAVVSPAQLYHRIAGLTRRFLFPFVSIEFYQQDRRRLSGSYRFEAGFKPSQPFLDTVRGILVGLPQVVGAPEAAVSMRRGRHDEMVYDVVLAGQWLGLADAATSTFRRAVQLVRVQLQNPGEAAAHLEESNLLLQEKVQALTETQTELNRQVRTLSLLDELSKVSSSERDLIQLLRRATAIISRELNNAPSAIMLAEGPPPRLSLASSVGLDPVQLRELTLLADPRHPMVDLLTAHRQRCRVDSAAGPLSLTPLVSQERIVGALVLPADPAYDEPSLMDPMADRLAVAVDNAVSYRLITDLRDNLEQRVQQRTGELEEAKSRLQITVEKLQRAQAAGQEFFTYVSHEFKTPLTLILAPLDDLEQRLGSGEVVDPAADLSLIRANAQRLLGLITEILEFAQLDAGEMPLQEQVFDMCQLVGDTVNALQPLAQQRSIGLTHTTPKAPLLLQADPQLLQRALGNLVSNAVKYCARHDRVSVRLLRGEGGEPLLEVQDNGPGIPQDQQERIFDRFQRVNDANGRTIEGSGIGLAIVREVTLLHGGSVMLTSDAEEGTCFRLRLPAQRLRPDHQRPEGHWPGPANYIVEAQPVQLPTTPEAGTSPSRSPGGTTVLLVEDDPDMRRFLTQLLSRQHTVEVARDGRVGLQRARELLPGAVVSDVMMPDLDGYGLCRELRADARTRNIPVLLVSASHDNAASLRGFEAGADDFVVKPFSPSELMARVDAQIRLRTLSRAVMQLERKTALGLLAGGVAHEVLNPVNVVINGVGPLRRALTAATVTQRQAETCQRMLDAIENSGKRIHRVVQDMLRLTHSGDEELELQRARVGDGLASILSLLQHRVRDLDGFFQDLRWDEPIQCYPALVNQVLLTLLVNALDAVADRRGNVWISSDRVDDHLVVRVRDDGPGVAVDDRERIFYPYFTTKITGANAGMGLAIAREIIGLHRGTIECTSAAQPGAEFVVRLPLGQ